MENLINQDLCYGLLRDFTDLYEKGQNNLSIIQFLDEELAKYNQSSDSTELTSFFNVVKILKSFLKGEVSKEGLVFFIERQNIINSEKITSLLEIIPHSFKGSNISLQQDVENMAEVNVIVTTYNRKRYLVDAVNSILKQNYNNIKVIIIDDCSNDGTDQLIKELYKNEVKVTYLRNKINKGPGFSRKMAFENFVTGEYVLFLDDDDYLIDSNYIISAVNFHVSNPNVSFVSANVFLEYSKTNKFKITNLKLAEVNNRCDYFINFEKKGFKKPFSTLTTVFKAKALIKMGINDMKMVNDSSIYLRALLVGDGGYLNSIVGVYRVHGDNITYNLSREFIIENLQEKMLIKNLAIDKYKFNEYTMKEWFDNIAYSTIWYYLCNSAKSHSDFLSMYNWLRINCPDISNRILVDYFVKRLQSVKKFTGIYKIRGLRKKLRFKI
ncbi:glycosyltransferase family 2 protein [Mesobacillus subterraneus]|uniref:glycosyltransferase family A protein n=1 Tax=Mesobacillus subterraneus TaxID=285983 RepID=UPI00203FD1DD|nr:glycosyltransferase family A protein [Mesobacillus subterraneus]MCM3574709.1 glycosyltransferase family 2 protein [Mesobacillus subterraneus]